MFSALNQGSSIFILDRTDRIKYKVGEVTAISAIRYNSQNQPVVDIKATIDGVEQTFPNVLGNLSVVSYGQGKYFISETKDGINSEISSILEKSKNILNNKKMYENNIVDCENILKDINPAFANEKKMRDDINSLQGRMNGFDDKLNQILAIISKTQQ